MNKKKIIMISSIALALIIVLGIVYLTDVCSEINDDKPDMSGWILENNEYKVIPTVDSYVSFKVIDKSGKTVFKNEKPGWRAWDFKSITLEKDNTIIIKTGDMGTQKYTYNSGTWKLDVN